MSIVRRGSVAVGFGVDWDVRGSGRESGGNFPNVEVATSTDARLAGQCSADLARVDAFGGGLEEDPCGGLHERGAGANHDPGDQQRDDRVRALEAGGQDHASGDRGADERVEVGQDVLVGAFDVEAWRLAFASVHVAARLTAIPTSATARIHPACTWGG